MFNSKQKMRVDIRGSIRSYGTLLLAILTFLLVCEILIFLLRLVLG